MPRDLVRDWRERARELVDQVRRGDYVDQSSALNKSVTAATLRYAAKRLVTILNQLGRAAKLKVCPGCGQTCDGHTHNKPNGQQCDMVYGRRGWRQLGMYDG